MNTPIISLNFPKNLDFKGRNSELKQLHQLLQTPPVGLTGMGGVGKTQLSIKYAEMCQTDYPGGIFGINATNDIREELADIAVRLDLPVSQPSRPDFRSQLITSLANYLKDHPKTLLIFDDVESPNALMEEILGPAIKLTSLGGIQLITTRQRQLPAGITPLSLDTLNTDPSSAREIILDGRPDLVNDSHLDILCEKMGYLPLGLNVAARSLREQPDLSIAEYLNDLDELGGMDALDPEASPDDYNYPSLTPVLRRQWQRLKADSKYSNACLLFAIAGKFDESVLIPTERLSLLSNIVDQNSLKSPLTMALQQLENLYFIELLEKNKIRLHPLVWKFSMNLLDVEYASNFQQECADNMLTAYENLERLASEYLSRGVTELQDDLLIAHSFSRISATSPQSNINVEQSISDRISLLYRLFKRCAPILGNVTTNKLLIQQLAFRIRDLGLEPLLANLPDMLVTANGHFIEPKWIARTERIVLEQTPVGHEAGVLSVAVYDAEQRAISASYDNTLKIWNLETGLVEKTLNGHEAGVLSVAVYDDEQRAISASYDNTLKIWNLETGLPEKTLKGHKEGVLAVSIIEKQNEAVSASYDKTLKIWNLETGVVENTLKGHDGHVYDVEIFDNDRKAISASADHTLKIWSLETGAVENTLQGHDGHVYAVKVFDNDRKAISVSDDLMIKVWSLDTGEVINTLSGHQDTILSVSVFDNGRKAISASSDRTLKIWSLETGQVEYTLLGHLHAVQSVTVFNRGRQALSASEDMTLRVWNLDIDNPKQALLGHKAEVRAISIFKGGNSVISASSDQTLKIWNLQTGVAQRILKGHTEEVQAIVVYSDDCRALSASSDRTLKIWDLESGEIENTLDGHTRTIRAVVVYDNESRAISASSDRTLKIWNLKSGEVENTLSEHNGNVNAVAIFDNESRAISASSDRTLKIWNLKSGEVEKTLSGHNGNVNAVAIFDNEGKAISASSDWTLRIWNSESGEMESTLTGHSGSVNAIAVFDNKSNVISVSSDQTLKIWDIETGTQILSLILDGTLTSVEVTESSSGTFIVAGDSIGSVYCMELVNLNNDNRFRINRIESVNGEAYEGSEETNNMKTHLTKPTKKATNQASEVYVSYAWGGDSEAIVDQLDTAFQAKGITILRDKRDVKYKDRISDFMRRLGQGDCIIVVIGKKYLESENCMFELLEISRNGEFAERVFPVILEDADIYDSIKFLQYIKYWEGKIDVLNRAMHDVGSLAHLGGANESINRSTNIRAAFSTLTTTLADMNALTPEMHRNSEFAELIEAVVNKLDDG